MKQHVAFEPRGFLKVPCRRKKDEIPPFSPSSYRPVTRWLRRGGRMKGRSAGSAGSERGAACRAYIGSRLRARRTHLGLTVNSVARELGIATDHYLAYETGAKLAPEPLLTRIAEHFGVPAFCFSAKLALKTPVAEQVMPGLKGRYRVATLEHRVNYLINAFCKLDLERQQQLLAVAGALAHERPW
jgi:transcriptional regulator with XRE-family HTH domain